MVIVNFWGMAGAMTCGFVAWILFLLFDFGGADFLAICTFLAACFGWIGDRMPAGQAVHAYTHLFGDRHPQTRIALFGAPLITAPFVMFVMLSIIPVFKGKPPPSWHFVVVMLCSCVASVLFGIATRRLRYFPADANQWPASLRV